MDLLRNGWKRFGPLRALKATFPVFSSSRKQSEVVPTRPTSREDFRTEVSEYSGTTWEYEEYYSGTTRATWNYCRLELLGNTRNAALRTRSSPTHSQHWNYFKLIGSRRNVTSSARIIPDQFQSFPKHFQPFPGSSNIPELL